MREQFDRTLIDRRNDDDLLYLFKCDGIENVKELTTNHYLGMHFDINDVARVRLHYGFEQRLRFWPEHLVWFIPRLFVKEKKRNEYRFAKRVYSDDYKHGFCVNLSDPMFDRYYKILTGYTHQSVNYRRTKWEKTRGLRFGFRDYVEGKVTGPIMLKLSPFCTENGYDSDAILQDMSDDENVEISGNSNIAAVLDNEQAVHQMADLRKRYKNEPEAECTMDHPLPISECQLVEKLVKSLTKFQSENFEVNAGNVGEFDEKSMIRGLSHLEKAHSLFSDDEQQKCIRTHLQKQIGCDLGMDCKALKQH